MDWLPIDIRIMYFEGIQVYNIIHGNCPRYLKDSIIIINLGGNTRRNANNNVLQIHITKLKPGQRTFKYRAANFWNQLDKKAQNMENIETFKHQYMKSIKTFLHCNQVKFHIDQSYTE